MDYLVFLQELRNGAGSFINETILFVSEFMGGAGGLAVMALVYWCLNKWIGSFMLLNFSSAYMANESLKNIFRVSRPFLLDDRLTPYVDATGYSFPSGHTMLGTAIYSSAAIWQRRRKWFVAVCAALILLTAFGRNWIGVHTPHDVLVGIAVSCAVVALNLFVLTKIGDSRKFDLIIPAAGIVWATILMILVPGCGKTCGIFLGVTFGWFIERRFIGFSVDGSVLRRVLRYVSGMAVVLAFNKGLMPLLVSPLGASAGALINNFVTFLIVTAGWPAVISLSGKKFAKA